MLTGFTEEAFRELKNHKDDPVFQNATLVLDAMSIKEYIQYDQKAKKNFGYVDYGSGSTAGNGFAELGPRSPRNLHF